MEIEEIKTTIPPLPPQANLEQIQPQETPPEPEIVPIEENTGNKLDIYV